MVHFQIRNAPRLHQFSSKIFNFQNRSWSATAAATPQQQPPRKRRAPRKRRVLRKRQRSRSSGTGARMQSEFSIAPSRLRSAPLTQPAAPTPVALSRASTRDRRLRILRRRLTAQFARSSSRWMMPPRSRGLAVAIGATCRVCSTGDMPHGFGKLPRRAARFAPALGQRRMIVASELPRMPLALTFPHCLGWSGRPQRRPLFFRPKNRESPRAL